MKPARGMKRCKLRKEERRKEAEERNSRWNSLSLKEQLAELDKRFGKGIGATKQRKKILAKIEKISKKEKE